MFTIWKFPLALTDRQTVRMPEGAWPLTVQVQDGALCLWAEVNTEAAMVPRQFGVFGTGHRLVEDSEYIATVQTGPLVWHVYELERGA